jgi:hypothetical protein
MQFFKIKLVLSNLDGFVVGTVWSWLVDLSEFLGIRSFSEILYGKFVGEFSKSFPE